MALAALCASKNWVCRDCDSLRAAKHAVRRATPRVVLTRHVLSDGFADDVLGALKTAHLLPATKVIVLLDRTRSSSQEARQVSLGADLVLRDPVRADVLVEYLARYLSQPKAPRRVQPPSANTKPFRFAGVRIDPVARRAWRDRSSARLTPREIQLAEILCEHRGQVVGYAMLYREILGVPFRGDTSNLRVLLGKLDASLRGLGTKLRLSVEVIPKTGYRYTAPRAPTPRPAKPVRSPEPSAP